MNEATQKTRQLIEKTLGAHSAFRRIDQDFYLVHQGSAYVYLLVLPWGTDRAIVRCIAQLAQGVEINPDSAIRLLKLNSRLRFGAFGYVREQSCVTLSHSIPGAPSLRGDDLLAVLRDLSILADEFDDEIVAEMGGQTMQALIEERNMLALRDSWLAPASARTQGKSPKTR